MLEYNTQTKNIQQSNFLVRMSNFALIKLHKNDYGSNDDDDDDF